MIVLAGNDEDLDRKRGYPKQVNAEHKVSGHNFYMTKLNSPQLNGQLNFTKMIELLNDHKQVWLNKELMTS